MILNRKTRTGATRQRRPPKTADLVTTSNQPEKLTISEGLYVPLSA